MAFFFRYLVPAGNFLNFRLCEIQLGAQCLLGENGPITLFGNSRLNGLITKVPTKKKLEP